MDNNELTQVLDKLRNLRNDESDTKTAYGSRLLDDLCFEAQNPATTPNDLELRLRIIGNLVANHEVNRKHVAEQHGAFLHRLCELKASTKESFVALSVLFNFANDNASGLEQLSKDPGFFVFIENCAQSGDVIALYLTQQCLEAKIDGFSLDMGSHIVTGYDILDGDEEDAEVNEVANVLRLLLESKPEREARIAGDKRVLYKFVSDMKQLSGTKTGSALSIALLGGVSFQDEFLNSIEMSLQDPIYFELNEPLAAPNDSPVSTVAMCAIALGNLTPSEDKIHRLVQLNGNIIPQVCRALYESQLAAELQCGFLLKNIATASIDYAKQILQHNGLDIVSKLVSFTIVPQIRTIGISLAKSLSKATSPNSQKELVEIVIAHINGDGFPLNEAVEMLADIAIDSPALAAQLVQSQWLPQLTPKTLLKLTRSLGIAISKTENTMPIQQLSNFVTDPVFDKLDTTDPLYAGIVSNLAYMAAHAADVSDEIKAVTLARVEALQVSND